MGLMDIGQPKEGETLVVAAASGAVGSVVGQVAKIKGLRAVGVAGGAEKCKYVVEELGFDACLDYKLHRDVKALSAALKDACPGGIDGCFENVGGTILDAVLLNMEDIVQGRNPSDPFKERPQIGQQLREAMRDA